jgi:hypothetical protein
MNRTASPSFCRSQVRPPSHELASQKRRYLSTNIVFEHEEHNAKAVAEEYVCAILAAERHGCGSR